MIEPARLAELSAGLADQVAANERRPFLRRGKRRMPQTSIRRC
jgi:hypothetical protein